MPLLLLDFDGTITQTDTINTLAYSVITRSKTAVTPGAWDVIVSAWLADYNSHVEAYDPPAKARTDPASELAFQESLRPVEMASLARVEKAGLFRGVPGDELREMGRRAVETGEVKLRDGIIKLLEQVGQQPKWGVSVVSVNWSGDWVQGVLDGAGISITGKKMVNRTAVEDGVVEGPEGFGRGRPLVTAGDKLAVVKTHAHQWEGATGDAAGWVYMGDSLTDLGCLLDASVGLVLAEDEESKLLMALRRVGCEVRHIGDCEGVLAPRRLVWARDFEEVLESRMLEMVTALEP